MRRISYKLFNQTKGVEKPVNVGTPILAIVGRSDADNSMTGSLEFRGDNLVKRSGGNGK